MSKKTVTMFLAVYAVILNLLGNTYLFRLGGTAVIIYECFLIINGAGIVFSLTKRLEHCILPVFTLSYWMLHMSLAVFRIGYVGIYSSAEIMRLLLLLLSATFVFVLGLMSAGHMSAKPFKFAEYTKVPRSVYYIFLLISALYLIFKIHFAGGLGGYLLSGYQSKIPTTVASIFFVVHQITVGFDYLNLVVAMGKNHNVTTWIARFYFLVTIVDDFFSGGSTGILYLLLGAVLILLFRVEEPSRLNGRIFKSIPIVIVGIVSGLLIRFNRNDYSNFNLDVLKNLSNNILGSATFDCLENLIRVTRDFRPSFLPRQIVYPFINWIPSTFASWKPEELASAVAKLYYNVSNGGFAPSPMGDFYVDFGYLGIFLGMLMLGVMVIVIQKRLNASVHGSEITIWLLIALVYTLSNMPNWYTGLMTRLFYLFVLYELIYLLTRIRESLLRLHI